MMMEYLQKIVDEVIITEKTYVHQLHILLKFFSVPLQENQLISPEAHSTIFNQLPAIYSTNKWLLEELDSSQDNIPSAFIKFGPFLKAYSAYASNFQKSVAVLQNCQSTCDELRKFISSTETRPEVQMSISALLITPIQRIPRYKLLLEQFLRHVKTDDDLQKDISDALTIITSIADHLNLSLENALMVQRLLVIQKSLRNQQPNIILPGRRIIKEGCLNKVSKNGNNSQERIFFLFSDVIMYAKAVCRSIRKVRKYRQSHVQLSDLKPNSLECCCVLPLRFCEIKTVFGSSDHGLTFRLICQSEDLVLYSDNAKEANEWIEAIDSASKVAISKRSTLRKTSSNEKTGRHAPLRKRNHSNGFIPNESNCLLSQMRSTIDCIPSPKIWLENRRNSKRITSSSKADLKRRKLNEDIL